MTNPAKTYSNAKREVYLNDILGVTGSSQVDAAAPRADAGRIAPYHYANDTSRYHRLTNSRCTVETRNFHG